MEGLRDWEDEGMGWEGCGEMRKGLLLCCIISAYMLEFTCLKSWLFQKRAWYWVDCLL